MEVADDGPFAAFEAEDFLYDLNVDDPVYEGDEVAGVDAMPESADHDCIELSHGLLFLFSFLIFVVLGVVNIFIDVSSEGPLNTNVPVVNFYLHVGL